MAAEIQVSGCLIYNDGVARPMYAQVSPDDELTADVATLKPISLVQSIGITEEAITLPEGGGPGYCWLRNLDTSNFINVKVATSGAIFAKLLPGEFCLLRLGSGAQVPYAIADTAACKMEILIIPS